MKSRITRKARKLKRRRPTVREIKNSNGASLEAQEAKGAATSIRVFVPVPLELDADDGNRIWIPVELEFEGDEEFVDDLLAEGFGFQRKVR